MAKAKNPVETRTPVGALYIHIPFCNQICSYCDFPKVSLQGQDTDAYLTALIEELAIYEKTVGFAKLQTIYIGGGTPTALTTKQLDRLFTYLHSIINFHHLVEVSIEANPESLTDIEKIACLKRNGITRISLGVQTFQEKHLQILERSHSKKEACEVIALLSKENFEINLDLIYGIPTETLKDWEKDLDILLQLPITHVSAYSLIVEEHTKLYIDHMKNKLELIDNEIEAQMFELAIDKLTEAGFEHYEISNFTKNNRSTHNVMYWKNEYYIGVGLGAHGHLEVEKILKSENTSIAQEIINGNNSTRYENTRSMTAYKKALKTGELPVLKAQALTREEQIEESMFLGMRLMEGVNLNQLQAKYQVNIYELYKPKLDKLRDLGYVSLESGVLRLTRKGLMIANNVFEEFLL